MRPSASQFLFRAQLSIEALLMFALFLSLAAIAYAATSKTAAAAQEKISFELSRSAFFEFSAKLRSVCIMGEGNIRTIETKGPPAIVEAHGKSFSFSAGKFSQSANSSCEITVQATKPSAFLVLENKGGIITVS